jgi:phage terminase small subunit
MGEVIATAATWQDDRASVVAFLRKENPVATLQAVSLYADAFCEYRAAMRNIAEHGAIVLHPRTGAPVDNPFLKVRDAARKALQDMTKPGATKLRSVDGLWSES